MKDETIIKWDFAQLFGDVPCVSAKVNAPKSNPGLKRDYLSKIKMVEWQKCRYSALSGRHIAVDIDWHHRKDEVKGGSWGSSLIETLTNAGATSKGCKPHDSFTVFWEIAPRERFSDGAMRIAKMLFEMLEVKIEGVPLVTDQKLVSLFVVYKLTWIKINPQKHLRFDDYLRQRHHLPKSPPLLHLHVL